MSSTTGFTASSTQMIQSLVNTMVAPILEKIFFPEGPTIVVAAVLVVTSFIFLFMTFGRARRSNGLSSSTNRTIGSVCYFIAHGAVLLICFYFFGIDMFVESIFYMLHVIAFMWVRIFLLGSTIWVY
jgi:hypothetical protein